MTTTTPKSFTEDIDPEALVDAHNDDDSLTIEQQHCMNTVEELLAQLERKYAQNE